MAPKYEIFGLFLKKIVNTTSSKGKYTYLVKYIDLTYTILNDEKIKIFFPNVINAHLIFKRVKD